MSMWSELGIEQTHDLRAIKAAYARRLKTVRPDEHPESFKRLHAAYKSALAAANDRLAYTPKEADVSARGSEHAELDRQSDRLAESLPETCPQDMEKSQGVEAYWAEEGDRLLNRARVLLSDSRELYQVDSWRFFEQSPLILDISFNEQLAVAVFHMLTEHQRAAKRYSRLSSQVVTYLDTIFGWSRHAPYFYSQFGQHSAERILRMVEEHTVPKQKNMGLRGGEKLILERQSLNAPVQQNSRQGQRDTKSNNFSIIMMIIIFLVFLSKVLP